MVEGLGARGVLITAQDDVGALLQQAQQLHDDTGASVLVNALIGKSTFREGSISV